MKSMDLKVKSSENNPNPCTFNETHTFKCKCFQAEVKFESNKKQMNKPTKKLNNFLLLNKKKTSE